MFYRKNLPEWERHPRRCRPCADWLGLLAFPAAPLGYAIAAGEGRGHPHGFFGFFPMCAMVGRKLPSA